MIGTIVGGISLNILSNRIDSFISLNIPSKQYRKLSWKALLSKESDYTRISIAYLIRIKIDGKYLLVKSNRIDNKFQPVGGVRKYYSGAKGILDDLGFLDDDCLPIDENSRGDLRIRIPTKKLVDFFKWYDGRKSREVDQTREFNEELLATSILPQAAFQNIQLSYLHTYQYLHFSEHFNTDEILHHEVYELIPTIEQETILRNLIKETSEQFVLVDDNLIRSKGHDKQIRGKLFSIADHTVFLLGPNIKVKF